MAQPTNPTTDPAVRCAHCGLPAPPPVQDDLPFCCEGCRGAYALIHNWGLEDYYALRDQLGKTSLPVSQSISPELFDSPELLGEALKTDSLGQQQICLPIRNIHCGACAWLIERSVSLHPGWTSARVNVTRKTVELCYHPQQTTLSEIATLLGRLGYPLSLPREESDAPSSDYQVQWRNLAIAGFCFANAMWIAVSIYAGRDGSLTAAHRGYLELFGTGLALLAVVVPGQVFHRSAWAALRTWTPHIDLPISLGLWAGAIGSVVSWWTGLGETYFDSVIALVFFLLLGRQLQQYGQHKATLAVTELAALAPPLAWRVDEQGNRQLVRASQLKPGELVECPAGDVVPVDGIIIMGTSNIDASMLSGESRPVEVNEGTEVVAGMRNLSRPLRIQARAVAGQTRVSKLSRLVGDALADRTPLVQLADRVGGVFVIVITLLAAGVFAFNVSSGWVIALAQATAILVVACPCALALATPLAIGVSIGRAARRQILVRSGDVFEALGRQGTIWFDKTGTLTRGEMTLALWEGNDNALQLAASLEVHSQHPLAKVVIEAAQHKGLLQLPAGEVELLPRGIRGIIDGCNVVVGTLAQLEECGVAIPLTQRQRSVMLASEGLSPCFVVVDGKVSALFATGDSLRPGVGEMIGQLQQQGWQVGLLSGDHPQIVSSLASELGIAAQMALGGLQPEEKLERIKASVRNDQQRGQTTVFVGDGINDAAALAAATVGIATQGAAEVSLQAANIYLAGEQVTSLPLLMTASRNTVHSIYRLLSVSVCYNLVAVTAACLGYVGPLTAAILMPLSSLGVILMAVLSRTFPREPMQGHQKIDPELSKNSRQTDINLTASNGGMR